MRLRSAWGLVRQTFKDYFDDKAARLAAALAYYALMALAPVLFVCIALVGLVVGTADARAAVEAQATALLGEDGGKFIDSMMDRVADRRSGTVDILFGTAALLVGAGGVFVQLQDALNTVWEVKTKPGLSLLRRIQKRLSAYAILMAVAFLLLVSLAISAALSSLSRWNDRLPGHEAIWFVVDALVGLAVLTVLFGLLFRHVPDAKVRWRDVWIGAVATAGLFLLGKAALGLYLGRPETTQTFGGAAALVAIAIWVYYCSQILLIGAEFTQAYAHREGAGITPDKDAVRAGAGSRANEGLDQ